MRPSPSCLMLCTEFPPGPGGIGTHAVNLARGLATRGWRVHVVAPQDYVSVQEREAYNAAQPFSITTLTGGLTPVARVWSRGFALAAATRGARPDVVVASGSRALWAGALVARVLRRPFVVVGHGSEFAESRRGPRGFTHLAARSAQLVVAVSGYTAKLIANAGVAPGSITVVYNGADSRRFRPGLDTTELRRRLDLHGRRVVLTVGQVSERKAQDVVVRALARIIPEWPDLVYVVVGLPTLGVELEKLAQELGVADAVRLIGAVAEDALPLYYNLCDLFVLVSRRASDGDVEGFGIVVREAALCGATAVVSSGSGLQEAVSHGETGLVVPPESPQATAEAITRLLGDDSLRERMGLAARAVALQSTWEHQIGHYDRLFRRVALLRCGCL